MAGRARRPVRREPGWWRDLGRVTASAAAALARRAASAGDSPSARAARNTPECASPAPVVSTAATAGAGIGRNGGRAGSKGRRVGGKGRWARSRRSGGPPGRVAGGKEAAGRADADDDAGAGGAGKQATGRLLGGGGAAEQGGLAGVAAQPVAAGQHGIEHRVGDLRRRAGPGRRRAARPAAAPPPRRRARHPSRAGPGRSRTRRRHRRGRPGPRPSFPAALIDSAPRLVTNVRSASDSTSATSNPVSRD